MFKNINIDKPNPPLIFISLDLVDDSGGVHTYKSLSAIDKISLIEKGITYACETLKQKDTSQESMWILSWREHGISESNSDYATLQTIALFKSSMNKLTTKYPKLTIIAGTIKTQRQIDAKHQDSVLKNIEKRYSDLKDISTLEMDSTDKQLDSHKKKFTEVMQQMKQSGFSVVRNTCYFFPGTYKRSKSAAYNEIDMDKKATEIFYPGKTSNISSTLTLRNNQTLTLGLEICYEHNLGTLKHINTKPVFLHLVLSDSTNLQTKYLNGIYNLHIDSLAPVRFITTAGKNDPKMLVYQLDMNALRLHNQAQLEGPLKPEKLFHQQISQGIQLTDPDTTIKEHITSLDKAEINDILSWAVYYSDKNLLIALFKYGVPVDTVVNKDTSLASAMEKDHSGIDKTEIIKILLDHKADPAIQNNHGETPLHVGAQFNQSKKIKLLLSLLSQQKQKAIINLTDKLGKSAAHHAAENNHDIEILQLLLEYGADLTLKDKSQKSALDYLALNTKINPAEKNKFILSLKAKQAAPPKP